MSEANVIMDGVKITLDKERVLLLDLNGMIEFEEETGMELLNGFDTTAMNTKQLRLFLSLCFKCDDPEMTPEKAGKLINLGNISRIMDALNQLLDKAMPGSDGEEGQEKQSP